MSDSDHSPALHPAAARLLESDNYHLIPFDPVPVKARHDGWTEARQRGFIDRLVVTGCVAVSARAVGKSATSAYDLRAHAGGADFARAWDEALESGRSYQQDIAIARCLTGERVPVMYRGRQVGERVRHDNRLVIAVLCDREKPGRSRRTPRTGK